MSYLSAVATEARYVSSTPLDSCALLGVCGCSSMPLLLCVTCKRPRGSTGVSDVDARLLGDERLRGPDVVKLRKQLMSVSKGARA